MDLTSHITHSYYITYYRSNGIHQLFWKLKPKPKLNPPNAHRSQIKICVSNMPNVPNAFRILKPIQKSAKRVGVFRNTGANVFAKNQMRLAYEDKRDLHCIIIIMLRCYYDYRHIKTQIDMLCRKYLKNKKKYYMHYIKHFRPECNN